MLDSIKRMFEFIPNISFLMPVIILLVAAIAMFLAGVSPSPQWLADTDKKAKYSDPSDKSVAPRTLWMIGITLFSAIGLFYAGLSFVMAIIGGLLLAAMVVPLIGASAKKKMQKRGRKESLVIAEYVAGRMSSTATLLIALQGLMAEHNKGSRSIPITAPGLESAIRSVNLGKSLHGQMIVLRTIYEDYPELSGMWRKYAIMSDSSLGSEAMVIQADDLAENLRQMDELREILDTELTLSTMTRYFMFILIGGFTLYLIFFGGGMGDVLLETTAGNIIVGISLVLMFVAQKVGEKIETMPRIWF